MVYFCLGCWSYIDHCNFRFRAEIVISYLDGRPVVSPHALIPRHAFISREPNVDTYLAALFSPNPRRVSQKYARSN